MRTIFLFLVGALSSSVVHAQSPADVPTFKVDPEESSIKFSVKASISLDGTFDKWTAALTFGSTDPKSGNLDVKIQADSVNTGSGIKDGKLKSKDFFDVEHDPYITFKSTKVIPTGPNTFEVDGNFTIRGVTRAEKLTLTISGEGTGSGTIAGTMAFDRKEYGMNSGIPFIRIADRVEVSVDLKVKRVGGPPLAFGK
jgi:polyisoprenoid-binding protein YceI